MKNEKGSKKVNSKKTNKTSAKSKVVSGKRLSNEALMDKLVGSKATNKTIKKQFADRYKGQTPEYIAKRIKIYKSISMKRLGVVEGDEKKTVVKKGKSVAEKGKSAQAKNAKVEETPNQAVNA